MTLSWLRLYFFYVNYAFSNRWAFTMVCFQPKTFKAICLYSFIGFIVRRIINKKEIYRLSKFLKFTEVEAFFLIEARNDKSNFSRFTYNSLFYYWFV